MVFKGTETYCQPLGWSVFEGDIYTFGHMRQPLMNTNEKVVSVEGKTEPAGADPNYEQG
jgi:hypothetical protein